MRSPVTKTVFLLQVFVACLLVMPIDAFAASDDRCAEPDAHFNLELKNQVESLRGLFVQQRTSAENKERGEQFIALLTGEMCQKLVDESIDSAEAIASMRTLRLHVFNCRTNGAVAEHLEKNRDSGRYGMLAYHSAQKFCSSVEKLRSYQQGVDYIFLDDYRQAGRQFGEELFCTLDILFNVPEFMPIIGKDLQSYPPRIKLVESLNRLCEQLKSGEIDDETARRMFDRARIEAFGKGDYWEILPFVHHVAKNNFGEGLAWPVIVVGGLSLLVLIVSFPLWILSGLLGRLNPGRYLWDDLNDWFAGAMSLSFIVFSILSIVVYADSLMSFLEGVGVLVGIIASVVGIVIGLKKLTQAQKAGDD